MNDSVFKTLECCRKKNFKYFVKDASSLSCGNLIYKDCLPEMMMISLNVAYVEKQMKLNWIY
jgi:hypothetical protein